MDMGGGATYQMFGKGEVPVGGMYATSPEKPMPPNWLPYIRVPDADLAAEQAKALGATIVQEPMEVPGGDRIAVLVDPQGATVAVHSTKA
jgi:predicted enzyme related to lactoylglutathione lyase